MALIKWGQSKENEVMCISKLWNNVPNKVKMLNWLSFKNAIQKWYGPECHCGYCL